MVSSATSSALKANILTTAVLCLICAARRETNDGSVVGCEVEDRLEREDEESGYNGEMADGG